MRIAICDDVLSDLEALNNAVSEYYSSKNTPVIIDKFHKKLDVNINVNKYCVLRWIIHKFVLTEVRIQCMNLHCRHDNTPKKF